MFCPNCRRQLPDGTKFCSGCGTPIRAVSAPVSTPVTPAAPPVSHSAPAAPAAPAASAPKPDVLGKIKGAVKKIPTKFLAIGGIALAAIVVIILLISLLGGSSEPNYALYIKDDQVYFNDFSKNAPYQITDDLIDDADNSVLSQNSYYISMGMCLTEDGKTLFYLDKLDLDDETGTLYYRSTAKPGKDATKIDSGVTQYSVSKDGKTVTYLKDDTLYQSNLKDETKIAKDVSDYTVTDDGKTVLYYTEDEDEYTCYLYTKGETEEVCSGDEISISIQYTTEDLKTVYYLDEDTLYKKAAGKDRVKLATDVSDVFGFQEDGTFYYIETADVSLADYFEPSEYSDYWMEELKAYETTLFGILYYFDGKDAEVLSDSCITGKTASADGQYVLLYTPCDASIDPSFTMDELEEYYYSSSYSLGRSAEQMVKEAIAEDSPTYIVINGTSSEISLENICKLRISNDGKTLYALCDQDEETGECDLYKAVISGTKVGEFEEVDDSVSPDYGSYFASYGDEYSDYFYYFKDVEGWIGELCVNGESVDDDVYVYNVRYIPTNDSLGYLADYDEEDGEGTLKLYNGKDSDEIADDVRGWSFNDNGHILFITDYDDDNGEGALNLYNGKKSVEIAEDVRSYRFTPDGNILYLYDYSNSSYRGDLALYNGKKSVEIDEDVVALLWIYDSTYHYVG